LPAARLNHDIKSEAKKERLTLLTRVILRTAVQNVKQHDVLESRKAKGLGHGHFPSTSIKSGCSSEPVSYRSEHKGSREAQYCVGLHSTFTFVTLRAFHLQPAFLCQICNLSPELPQQGFSEPLRQYFPPDFPMALYAPMLWQVHPWKLLPLV